MKTLLTLALAAALGASSYANESNEKALAEVRAKDSKVSVTLREGAGKVRLAILDTDGKKLHQQTVHVKNDLRVPYDLSELPAGEYKVMIESNINQSFSEKEVFTVETKSAPDVLPLMAYGKAIDDDSIKLTVIGLEEPGVKVEITDSKGKNLHIDKIDEPEAFSRVYSFKNIDVKDVSITVTDNKGRVKNLYF
ncbi:DUF3244 domain-containing protein [Shivajiella indica]|uniref:DUF3244 domain-containing protein n=1 Tax=Shivajiella indica TaxID=872115 RepID=A0ABW5B6L9_9BACT